MNSIENMNGFENMNMNIARISPIIKIMVFDNPSNAPHLELILYTSPPQSSLATLPSSVHCLSPPSLSPQSTTTSSLHPSGRPHPKRRRRKNHKPNVAEDHKPNVAEVPNE